MSNYSFGSNSIGRLNTCHQDIIAIMNAAICNTPIDFAVIEGHRTQARQAQLFVEEKTTLDGVDDKSRHQSWPSEAIDLAPYPIQWDGPFARERFYWLSGVIFAHARILKIPIRWGGDWDGDSSFVDQKFHDLPHFELLR